ncbi:MAG: T9SS type A sorting domain-containing protein [Flavobacteriales bacterium]|nr:T9SS type A sorting domain-containing protein [Flavobacteriales bacterium]
MFQKFSLFLVFISLSLIAVSQDYLVAPSSNPMLFKTEEDKSYGRKLAVFETNFNYLYDTLDLPFIDDFSVNHFPKRITDTSDSRLTRDSIAYRILIGNAVYRRDIGFTTDSTFSYVIGVLGDTISRQANGPITIQVTNLTELPRVYEDVSVFQAFNYYDTLGVAGDSTANVFALYRQDSLIYYTVTANPNDFYIDRFAYLNNTFGLNPPSIGVVTFDGLDDFGLPYDFDNPITVLADEMTSVPINLGNASDTNVYFSFFYQPMGISINKPEGQDSLVLEFYNVLTKRWGSVWNTILDTNNFDPDSFIQVVRKVPVTSQQNGFQFRFKNYANSSGGFDQWHIDYLYMDQGRTGDIIAFDDLAYMYDAPSMLKDYYAMPYFHYINDPTIYMKDTVYSRVKNNADEKVEVVNFLTIPDTTTGMPFYRFPLTPTFNFLPAEIAFSFEDEVNFEFPIDKVDSAGFFESIFDIKTTTISDFISSNDTVISRTVLDNYYAYDDGTAEAGYGVNPDRSQNNDFTAFMAVQFDIPFSDTLEGFRTYFLPQGIDITNQKFILTVWSSLVPGGIIYQKPVTSAPFYSGVNGFIDYSFDTSIVVPTSFYIGFKALGRNSLNIGYDLNTNHRDKIYFSQNGSEWSNPSAGIEDGSLMLRPVFRTRLFDVGLDNRGLLDDEIKVYPNPTNSVLYLKSTDDTKIKQLQMFDLTGKLVLESHFKNQLDLSALTKGIYFLRFIGQDASQLTKKIIVSN